MRVALISWIIIGAWCSLAFAASQTDQTAQLYRDIEQSGFRIQQYHSNIDNKSPEFNNLQSDLLTNQDDRSFVMYFICTSRQ